MKSEYRLRIIGQDPIIISQAQLDACRDGIGVLKFGRVNEVVAFGKTGVNLKDVRGWEEIHTDSYPTENKEWSPEVSLDGIRKLRLIHAAFDTLKQDQLSPDEKKECQKIMKSHQDRKSSPDYALFKQFRRENFDQFYRDGEAEYRAFEKWKEENPHAEEEFIAVFGEPSEPTPAQEEIERVKMILKGEKLPDFELPF